MSGAITLAAIASYAVSIGTGIYSAVSGGAQALADPASALLGLNSSSAKNQQARSQLLETQGASAGDPLKSGDVSSGANTPNGYGNGNVFGN